MRPLTLTALSALLIPAAFAASPTTPVPPPAAPAAAKTAPAKSDAAYETAVKAMMEDYDRIGDSFMAVIPQMMQANAIQTARLLQRQFPNEDPKHLEAFAKTYFAVTMEKLQGPFRQAVLSQTRSVAEDLIRTSYTRQEVLDLYTFNQSPSGRSIKEKTPKIMQQMATRMPSLQKEIDAALTPIFETNTDAILKETITRLHTQGIDFGATPATKTPATTPAKPSAPAAKPTPAPQK